MLMIFQKINLKKSTNAYTAGTAEQGATSFPGSSLLWSKDPGGRWSRDLLKSSRFLISVVLSIWEGWECSS